MVRDRGKETLFISVWNV